MGAMASAPFPGLNAWKDLSDKNPVLLFIDSVISSWSQIIFSDNSLSGLLIMVAALLVSPQVLVGGLTTSIVSIAIGTILGSPALPRRMGVYSFPSALSGIIMSGLLFPEGMTIHFFVFMALAGVFSTLSTMALATIFSRYDAAALGLPFAITTLVFMAAAQNMGFVGQSELVMASAPATITPADLASWNLSSFAQAAYAGFSELVGGAGLASFILIAIALLISSRIDFVSAVVGTIIGAGSAIFFGCPSANILVGLFGYNTVLLLLVLNGRAFRITPLQVVVNLVLALLTSVLSAWLAVSLGLVGAVATAFPFSIIACLMMLAAPNFSALKTNPPSSWGVPETIQANKEALAAQP